MYYSNGNYEAFARPLKPEGIENKHCYLVGSGIGSLAAACFLIRDAQMPGKNIHILEEMDILGGACDGIKDPTKGFIIRGGREMENHYECLWDLFRSIPSLEIPNASVLDEFYWLNKADPNFSYCRVIEKCGQDAHTDDKFGLTEKAKKEIINLYLADDAELYNKKISDYFTDETFNTNFWIYWRTMFAFENWHSALEMKLYLHRFIHHIKGLPDLSALKFTKYNQYESLILPMVAYLKRNGVDFQLDTRVTNVIFDISADAKVAKQIQLVKKGQIGEIDLGADDYVLITNGSCTENSSIGDNNTVPSFNTTIDGCWQLWKNIARQSKEFGNPDKFIANPELTYWESATVTLLDKKVAPYIEKISRRDPYAGKVVTGGIVSIKDSNWLMSYTLNRQPHFKSQPKDQLVVWVYALFGDKPGNYVKKNMRDCTGIEITKEWLYHLGVPTDQIDDIATHSCICNPCMMPYITAFFMPREAGDRPLVVPNGAKNFGFLGQFVDIFAFDRVNYPNHPEDTVFTTEYSVRTAMEAVYTLFNVDRGVPEVFASSYDIRCLLQASYYLDDKVPLFNENNNMMLKGAQKVLLHKFKNTDLIQILKENFVMEDTPNKKK